MLKVYKIKEYAEVPSFATQGSACLDIKAAFSNGERIKSYNAWNKQVDIVAKTIGGKVAVQIPPESRVLIPSGLIFDVPENFVLKVYVRSSVALKKGLVLVNSVGIVDSDYVDETYLLMHNISDSLVVVESGERLAQCALEPVLPYDVAEINEPPAQKTDRTGGLGSTGKT